MSRSKGLTLTSLEAKVYISSSTSLVSLRGLPISEAGVRA